MNEFYFLLIDIGATQRICLSPLTSGPIRKSWESHPAIAVDQSEQCSQQSAAANQSFRPSSHDPRRTQSHAHGQTAGEERPTILGIVTGQSPRAGDDSSQKVARRSARCRQRTQDYRRIHLHEIGLDRHPATRSRIGYSLLSRSTGSPTGQYQCHGPVGQSLSTDWWFWTLSAYLVLPNSLINSFLNFKLKKKIKFLN